MIAVNYSTIRNNLKGYCDRATDENEIVIVTRKEEKNVVIMSLDQYNEMIKQINNNNYLAMLKKALEELRQGGVVLKSIEELDK